MDLRQDCSEYAIFVGAQRGDMRNPLPTSCVAPVDSSCEMEPNLTQWPSGGSAQQVEAKYDDHHMPLTDLAASCHNIHTTMQNSDSRNVMLIPTSKIRLNTYATKNNIYPTRLRTAYCYHPPAAAGPFGCGTLAAPRATPIGATGPSATCGAFGSWFFSRISTKNSLSRIACDHARRELPRTIADRTAPASTKTDGYTCMTKSTGAGEEEQVSEHARMGTEMRETTYKRSGCRAAARGRSAAACGRSRRGGLSCPTARPPAARSPPASRARGPGA